MLETTRAYDLEFAFPGGDTAVGASLRDYGEFARPEVDLICDHLAAARAAGTFLDVGANIGAMALPVAARHRDWKVVAYEASRALAGVLAGNVRANGLDNVEPVHAAVGAAAGVVDFPAIDLESAGNLGTLAIGAAGPTETVRMCALDQAAPADTAFVKIDVEGYEGEVLRGAQRLLAEGRAAWLLEAGGEHRDQVKANIARLQAVGYRLFWFYAPFVTGAPLRKGPYPKAWRGDLNILALPAEAANLWDLAEIAGPEAPWPTRHLQFPYLARYGFRLQP